MGWLTMFVMYICVVHVILYELLCLKKKQTSFIKEFEYNFFVADHIS